MMRAFLALELVALASALRKRHRTKATQACDETYTGTGDDYRGCLATTRTGRVCQSWDSQSPHTHQQDVSQGGLGSHNQCRNPDGEDTIWCYTADPKQRWEHCESPAEAGWDATLDSGIGPCATQVRLEKLPIYFPLLCTDDTTISKMFSRAKGSWSPQLRYDIDNGRKTGRRVWDLFPADQTWEEPMGSLHMAKGYHTIAFYPNDNFVGDMNIELVSVRLEGWGQGVCSFDMAKGHHDAMLSNAYSGLDALTALKGPAHDFSELHKRQLYFTEEAAGTNADLSISSTVVHDGIWKWIYSYSQDPRDDDQWGSIDLWAEKESEGPPWPQLALDPIPGRTGQKMQIYEPCNTLSALAFNEAAVWVSCKRHPFSRDQFASVIAAFNGLSAGTAFQHVCSCQTGGRADTFTMDWLLGQIYQIMIDGVLSKANATPEQVSILKYFGKDAVEMTDVAKNLTALFSTEYDREKWWKGVSEIQIPEFFSAVAGVLGLSIWALAEKIPISPLHDLLTEFLKVVMDLFPLPEKDWFLNTWMPTVRTVLGSANLCGDATLSALDHVVKFCLTYVEAMVFQEKQIPVPKAVRDVIATLDNLGLTSNLFSDMVMSFDKYNGYNCTDRSDHANWHEKAAHGLVHAVSLAELFADSVCTA